MTESTKVPESFPPEEPSSSGEVAELKFAGCNIDKKSDEPDIVLPGKPRETNMPTQPEEEEEGRSRARTAANAGASLGELEDRAVPTVTEQVLPGAYRVGRDRCFDEEAGQPLPHATVAELVEGDDKTSSWWLRCCSRWTLLLAVAVLLLAVIGLAVGLAVALTGSHSEPSPQQVTPGTTPESAPTSTTQSTPVSTEPPTPAQTSETIPESAAESTPASTELSTPAPIPEDTTEPEATPEPAAESTPASTEMSTPAPIPEEDTPEMPQGAITDDYPPVPLNYCGKTAPPRMVVNEVDKKICDGDTFEYPLNVNPADEVHVELYIRESTTGSFKVRAEVIDSDFTDVATGGLSSYEGAKFEVDALSQAGECGVPAILKVIGTGPLYNWCAVLDLTVEFVERKNFNTAGLSFDDSFLIASGDTVHNACGNFNWVRDCDPAHYWKIQMNEGDEIFINSVMSLERETSTKAAIALFDTLNKIDEKTFTVGERSNIKAKFVAPTTGTHYLRLRKTGPLYGPIESYAIAIRINRSV